MSLPEVTDDHRERAQRMWGCMFDVEDLAQMLASHEAEVAELKKAPEDETQAAEHGDSTNVNLLAGAPVTVHFQSEGLPGNVEPLSAAELIEKSGNPNMLGDRPTRLSDEKLDDLVERIKRT